MSTRRSFGQFLPLNEQAVTSEALALDPQGRLRFLVHGYRSPFYPFTPRQTDTRIAPCDEGCALAENWTIGKIADREVWEGSTLRYDATGRRHVAAVVYRYGENAQPGIGAYLTCASGCDVVDSWKGISFSAPYESST